MNKSPLVSVIIASYQHRKYIQKTIESIISQTYSNIELIVIDDGSSDGSHELLTELSQRHGFIYKHRENRGLIATLNEGIGLARGKYFCPFSSDDIMLPKKISAQVAYLEAHPDIAVCATGYQNIDSDDNLLDKKSTAQNISVLDFKDVFISEKAGPAGPSTMINKMVFENAGGYAPDIVIEDLYLWLKITHSGFKIAILPEQYLLYRQHISNTTKKLRYMYENVLVIYAGYQHEADYGKVVSRFKNSYFIKAADRDPTLAIEILRSIRINELSLKTVRGLMRLAKTLLKRL